MQITSKGQVTIPIAIREAAGFRPNSHVSFEMRGTEVLVKAVGPKAATEKPSKVRAAFASMRGSANAKEFKHMNTDAFMQFLRG